MSKRKVKESPNLDQNKTRPDASSKRPRASRTNSNTHESPQEQGYVKLSSFLLNAQDSLEKTELTESYLKEFISSLVSKLGGSNKHSEALIAIFKTVINKKELDENMFIFILNSVEDQFLNKFKHLAEFLLECLTTKRLKFSPVAYVEMIKQTFRLASICAYQKRDLVYENIILLFLNVNFKSKQYLEEKHFYLKAEKCAIEQFKIELKKDQSGLISKEFAKSFKRIVEQNSVNSVLNKFVFTIYISLLNDLHHSSRESINECYFKALEKYFEVCKLSNGNNWIKSCLRTSLSPNTFMNTFSYTRLLQYLSQVNLCDNMIDFCVTILDKYGVEINEFFEQPDNTNESFTFLATNILAELFKRSNHARQKILVEFLSRCLNTATSDKTSVFISQLDVLLNSKSALKTLFGSKPENQIEKDQLNLIFIRKITSEVFTKSSIRKSTWLFQIENSEHAVRILHAFRVFLYACKKDKDTFDQLLELLIQNVNNSSIKSRKTAVYCLLELVVVLNQNHFDECKNLELNDSYPIRDGILNQNYKYSTKILDVVQAWVLNSSETNSAMKSRVYQSFYPILEIKTGLKETVNAMNRLLEPIAQIYLRQLGKYLVRSSTNSELFYFNLDKCVSIDDFKLTEPVDVLFHCADLFSSKALRLINTANQSFKSLAAIQCYVRQIKKVYLEKDAKILFDIYKSQLIDKVKVQTTPAACMKIMHQLELGFIDVVLEHCVVNDLNGEIGVVLDKYEATSSLISVEIENLMTAVCAEKQKTDELNKKRKYDSSDSKSARSSRLTLKRFKSTYDDDKENQKSLMSTNSKSGRRETLGNIGNIGNIGSISQAKNSNTCLAAIRNLSFANIQFEHEHRISFKCCIKMVKLYLGASSPKDAKISCKLSVGQLSKTVHLLKNEKFIEFLIKVAEKKLKSLENKHEIYDPQSQSLYQTYEFLSSLWLSFCQRINGSINDEQSVFKSDLTQRYGASFLNKTFRFVSASRQILSITKLRYRSLMPEMMKMERQYYCTNDPNVWYIAEKDSSVSNISWAFLKNCARSLKNLLNPTPSNAVIANKCFGALLNLVFDIIQRIELKPKHYQPFSECLYELVSNEISEDEYIGKTLIRMLEFISCKKNSSTILMQFVSLDYSNYVYSVQEDVLEVDRDPIDEAIQQFKLFNKSTNLAEMQQLITNSLQGVFSKFSWCLRSIELFDETSLFGALCPQLQAVVNTIKNVLNSVSNFQTAEINLSLMTQFYEFMTQFFRSSLVNNLNEDGLNIVSDLVEDISNNLQASLSTHLNRINDFIVCNEQQRGEKTNSKEILNIIKYKENMSNLVSSIDNFEQQLVKFNESKSDIGVNLLQNYKIFISSLELNFASRLVRTVSENEINTFLNINL